MATKKTYEDLQEITGHESGAVQYSDGSIWIGNWTPVQGIPREFVTGTIGLGETLTTKKCAVPKTVKRAMNDHERKQGTTESKQGFSAWEVNDVVVVIQSDWV